MNLPRLPLKLLPLLALVVFAGCAGNSTVNSGDEVEVQPGEVSVAQPTPANGAAPAPTSVTPSPAPTEPTQGTPGTVPGTNSNTNAPLQPPQHPTPCSANLTELLPGSWGGPDTRHNVASEAAVVHGDLVASVGGGLCGPLLETRTRGGALVSQKYLPRDLMDFHTGIAKFPRGGFILAGMRAEVLPANPGWSIRRMVIALVDEEARVQWKNDFAPEGPAMQNWGYAVVTDADGNSYVAADLNGFSVVKLNAKGERVWTYNYAENSGVARAIRFDAEGNVVATGYIDVNLQSEFGDRDLFVVKLSPKKKILWKHRVVTPTHDYAYDLAINNAGQIWVYGWSHDPGVTFRKKNVRLPATFLIRLEKNGTRSAIIDPGISGYTARIEVLPNQNLLLSGALISNIPSAANALSVALLSPDGLRRLSEKTFVNPYWNVLNFMTMSITGEIYIGSSSGTPVGQSPSYAFGSIRKLLETDLLSGQDAR